MKALNTVQKTFNVFKVLSRVVMILSFVAAGLALLGMTCGLAWRNGGTVMGMQMESMLSMTGTEGLDEMVGILLANAVLALADGVLFLFVYLYLKQEKADGTPFTDGGAGRLMRLGIQTIVLPMVAKIVASVIYGCYQINRPGDWGDGGFVLMGIGMILMSLVLRYGAELERRSA